MKKNIMKSGFNLIEVTLAIAIVGIGIAGVMALFPPAIEANKTANFQNFTGTVVNNVAAYLDYKLKRNWTFKNNLKEKTNATQPPTQTSTDDWDEITKFNGVFHIQKSSPPEDCLGLCSQDGSISAHVRIWQDNSKVAKYYINNNGSGTEKTPNSNLRIRVVIELSWPIAKTYADREKQEFVYEFNKPE